MIILNQRGLLPLLIYWNSMEKIVKIISVIIFYSQLVYSQGLTKITYQYQDDMGFASNSYLFLKDQESSFRIVDPRKNGLFNPNEISGDHLNDSLKREIEPYYVDNDSISTFFFSNAKFVCSRFPFDDGKELLYQQISQQPKWQLLKETKKIQGYTCKKASIVRNGRKFTAWFTLDIPLNAGPILLNGLPGLIIELIEDGGYCRILFQKLESNSDASMHLSIKKYVESKKLQDYPEYEKLMTKRILGKKMQLVNEFIKLKRENNLDSSGEFNISISNSDFYSSVLDLPAFINDALDKIKF